MTAFYNEIEPYAAQWTRNLIAAGHVAPGVVDERSIVELAPADVAGPGQRRHAVSREGGMPMTLEEQNRRRGYLSRDGGRWVAMAVWEHRRHAMIRDCHLRGMSDDAPIERCPAWKRSEECRRRRLERQVDHG